MKTSIEWTRGDDGTAGRTWNPVTGCTKVSPGCDHCYAENIARRFAGTPAFPDGFTVTLHPGRLHQPGRWRSPARVFVNSMSDLFHDAVPDDFLTRVFDTMEAPENRRHTFMVLTKRPARMRAFIRRRTADKHAYAAQYDHCPTEAMRNSPAARWARERAATAPSNIWLGVSVEDQQRANLRIQILLRTHAAVRFLSCEPLLGPIDLQAAMRTLGEPLGHGPITSYAHVGHCCTRLHGLDWVIAGAESGPGARPMNEDWVRLLRDQCTAAGTAFFYKQDADARGRKIPTPQLDGQRWTQFPERVTP